MKITIPYRAQYSVQLALAGLLIVSTGQPAVIRRCLKFMDVGTVELDAGPMALSAKGGRWTACSGSLKTRPDKSW